MTLAEMILLHETPVPSLAVPLAAPAPPAAVPGPILVDLAAVNAAMTSPTTVIPQVVTNAP